MLHIVGSFFPARYYGGPIEATRALCGALARLGVGVKVLTTNANGATDLGARYRGWVRWEGYDVYYANRWFGKDVSPGLAVELCREVPRADVVHLSGTYNWYLPLSVRVCRRQGRPLIVSPHGSLSEEARRRKAVKKQLFDRAVQRRALTGVASLLATSGAEGYVAMAPRLTAQISPRDGQKDLRAP